MEREVEGGKEPLERSPQHVDGGGAVENGRPGGRNRIRRRRVLGGMVLGTQRYGQSLSGSDLKLTRARRLLASTGR